ncbi:MAG TPA: M48 family metalloprotease [Gemmatimonadaceae bacterium]|nr:M48 family metalloprotease [Gemmatimonadaceae bacterium]
MAALAALPALAALAAGCAVSHADEIAMGAEYAAQLERELPLVHDPAIEGYLNVLGDSIGRPADARGLTWHFYVVNMNDVNAFAVPGGYVYITRGLVEHAATLSQLAGAMGHEIAHVTRRHAVKQLERVQRANAGVTIACVLTGVCGSDVAQVAVQVGGTAVLARYSREDEAEADDDAVTNVVRAGISPAGIPELFEELIRERETRPDAVSAWFATHPSEESRMARTRERIAALDPALLATLTVDSPRFQAFRARVAALPAPRAVSVREVPRQNSGKAGVTVRPPGATVCLAFADGETANDALPRDTGGGPCIELSASMHRL